MSVSSRRVLGLYRSMLRLTTKATLDKTHPRQNLLYRYVREQFRVNSTEKDANKVRQLYNLGNDLVEYHGTVTHHSELLEKYGFLSKMGQREYVRRQAEKVGLQIPLFHDEKPDKTKILRDTMQQLQEQLQKQKDVFMPVDEPTKPSSH